MKAFLPSNFIILMVDDNPKNLQLLGSTLRNEGYQLEFATSGQMALSWVEKKNFDLILLDIMMPEMSGFEVCEIIRKNEKNNDIPILFLTAKTEKESIVQGFELGAQDYITKPFDSAELLARVRTHLELRDSKIQLKEMNNWLDLKVKERTLELQVANNRLMAANEELITLDKAKSEFLYIISHEIRTPLNGIKGSVDLIKEVYKESDLDSLLFILETSVVRLERFAIMALKVTQLKMGRYELDFQPLPVNMLLNRCISSLSSKIEMKQLSVIQEPEYTEEIIEGDYELIYTCVTAIIDNAIKFSPSNVPIYIGSVVENGTIVLEIRDKGPGFTQKALNNLFQLFAPGEKHVNENEGIELALAKLIMDAHQGKIRAFNHPEGGAVVKLFFNK